MKTAHYLGLALVCTLILGGCMPGRDSSDSRQVLTVSIEPLRYFVEGMAGDKFRVECMVPDGSSPETYDPTPKQLVRLADSRAFFRIGHIGFERTWDSRLRQSAPDVDFFDTSRGVDLIEGTAPAHAHDGGIHQHAADPHIWASTINARIIVRNIHQALCRIDSNNKEFYTARLDSMLTLIERTEAQLGTLMSRADSAFFIYHPSLTYFARDFGLHQHAIESGGKEPTPRHLQELTLEGRRQGVHVVFIQQEFDTRHAEAVARQIGARVVPINPLDYEWPQQMLKVAEALSADSSQEVEP